MKGYVLDVKDRKWVVLCLENIIQGKTVLVGKQAFYFSKKSEAIAFAENKSGDYLVYIYKRVKTFVPWNRHLFRDLFGLDD